MKVVILFRWLLKYLGMGIYSSHLDSHAKAPHCIITSSLGFKLIIYSLGDLIINLPFKYNQCDDGFCFISVDYFQGEQQKWKHNISVFACLV